MAPRHPFLLLAILVLALRGYPGAYGQTAPAPPAPPVKAAARPAAAEARLTPVQAAAYAEVLKLRVDSARTLLAAEMRRPQPDPRAVLIRNCADFADLVLRQDARLYEDAMTTMANH